MEKVQTFYRVSEQGEDIFSVSSFMIVSPKSRTMRTLIKSIGTADAMAGYAAAKKKLDPILNEENSVWKSEKAGHMGAGIYTRGVAACQSFEGAKSVLRAYKHYDRNRSFCIFVFQGIAISDVWDEGDGREGFQLIPSCIVNPTKLLDIIRDP